jgi:hypothetical protein|tara:strand:+ start:1140 stop:1271 length:132 start_codon:yes stop_codon:yes gene_type:complete
MDEDLLNIIDTLESSYDSWRQQVVGILDEEDTEIIKETTNGSN